jgi:Kef-type K+ transport system membrane component KefB
MPNNLPTGTDQLLLQLFVIFVSAKLLGELFERLALPSVPGEILAGIILGPFVLGWVSNSDTLASVAQIGAIFILFSAGLETNPRDLVRVSRKALLVSVMGVLAPFILGFAYLKFRGDATVEAVFVAAAMVATSVAITARVLGEMNLLSTRTSRLILAAAVFDDVLGMLVLAVVAGAASETGVRWLHLGIVTAEAVVFALFMMFVAPKVVQQLHPKLERMSTQNASLIVALSICLFLSWLAAKIGMAAIIGGFFAGLMFAEYAPRWNLISRVGGMTEFLAPFFFFDIGMRFNPSLFASGSLVKVVVIVSLLALISKVIGCGLPLVREGWLAALQVGVGMMPRGEVSLIVALVGLHSKVLGETAYGVIVLMTVITTIIAAPALRYLFRQESKARTEGKIAATVKL